MNSLLLAAGCVAFYLLAYHTYGRYLARRLFGLTGETATPAHRLRDEVDFVPTRKDVLFGHHFTSIAGTGPIVGPAIGVIWGWGPALAWVVLGPVVIGAVHDLGALALSVRHDGRSIAEVIGKTVSARVRNLFFVIIFFELWIVIAIFALIIAVLFGMYPNSVLAVWIEVPIALWVGWRVRQGASLALLSVVGVALMYGAVWAGCFLPIAMPAVAGLSPVLIWMLLLFAYAGVASFLPVDRLLQPRDYLNSHQLLIAMGLLALGLVVAHPEMAAPVYVAQPQGAPAMFPFLFVIIACGAVSGFHSLVSSGTSSKQLDREGDALFVGYGSMLFEGGLAVLVLIACTAGLGMGAAGHGGGMLTGAAAYFDHYGSWSSASGLGAKLAAFVEGAANLIGALGVERRLAVTVMGVFIVSFAGTTLDTATRIQRYVVAELAEGAGLPRLAGRLPATLVAVASAMALAFYSGNGKGAMALWPIFGAVNQLLAGLALLAVATYLVRLRRPVWLVGMPLCFMVGVTTWAMVSNMARLWAGGAWLLAGLSGVILLLQAWMLLESWLVLAGRRQETAAGWPDGEPAVVDYGE